MKLTTARLKKLIREELENIEEMNTGSTPIAQMQRGGMGEYTMGLSGLGPSGVGLNLPIPNDSDGEWIDKNMKGKKLGDDGKLLNYIFSLLTDKEKQKITIQDLAQAQFSPELDTSKRLKMS
tara:strand:- start:77 stop:442 length:366 start_codon:yes stop_codon:yes gene_type:complete